MLRPEEIYNEQFELSVLGGYKREQVDNFFASVAGDYEKLFKENAELIQKLKVCVEKIDEYQKDEQFLKAAIINAEKLNETSLRDLEKREKEIEASAREKADSLVENAQLEAENIVKTAQLEAAEAIRACEIETAAKITELKKAQEIEEQKLNDLKKEISGFKESVLNLYRQHLNSLNKLPSYEEKPKETEDIKPEQPVAPASDTAVREDEVPVSQPVPTPIAAEEPDESESPVNAKTAEFVIEKPVAPSGAQDDDFGRNFKFKDLKFGTDFDIKKQK